MPARPPVSLPTTLSLWARSLSMSTVGAAKVTPRSDACWASSMTAATCSSALDGMQPTFRQTPPRVAATGAATGAAGADSVFASFSGLTVAFAAPASTLISTAPSLTREPSWISTSLTVPATVDGTSMVALSDSSVAIASSTLMLSPTLTNRSMTGTSEKSPISGTLTSMIWLMSFPSDDHPTHVGQQFGDIDVEAGGQRAVDDAVVGGQRQRQGQAWHELLAVPDRLHSRLVDAEDGNFRRIDDRCEVSAADAAQAGNSETGAGHVGRLQLAVAGQLGQLAGFLGDLEDALLVGVLDHRDDQAVGRVGRETDVEILLQHQVVAVERSVEFRILLQRLDASLDQEGQHGQFGAAALLVFLVQLNAEGFKVGDVGIFVIGHGRDHHPVA